MNNRREVAALVGAGQVSLPFAPTHSNPVAALDRVVSTTRLGLMVLGLASMTALTMMFFRPELTDQIKVLSPFWTEPASGRITTPDGLYLHTSTSSVTATAHGPADTLTAITSPAAFSAPSPAAQQRVTGWLSKRHRVAGAASNILVDAAYATAKETDIDPLLILSVMSTQARLNPFAENATGAQGLMQVMTDVHRNKFNDHLGAKSIQDPRTNLRVGAVLLKESIRNTGSIEAGLRHYIGADGPRGDGGYSARVMGEYARLQAVANGHSVAATKAHTNAGARRIAEKPKDAVDQPA